MNRGLRATACSFVMAAGALLLSGCGQSPDQKDQRGAEGKVPAPASSKAAADFKLELVSCEQWDKALAAQQGKIVVVDTWATWCGPCKEEFPGLVALHRKHAQEGVACMSVSVDAPDERGAALEFLKQQGAAFSNFLIDDKSDAWWDKWNIKGIPVVLVFDRDGKLVKKFDKDDPDNQFTYADVEKLVIELLERAASKRS
jgi:thiol-disulfide isomerase/thioredoxin